MRQVTSSVLLLMLLAAFPVGAKAAQLSVEIAPRTGDPVHPRMGDRLAFRSTIRNVGPDTATSGVVAWFNLLQVDPGKEQPVDLEDWSAQKAVTLPALVPGQAVETEWPLRLIQSGSYRAAVIAAPVGGGADAAVAPVASRFAGFAVAAKPVVESGRVLVVASGMPILLGAVLLWRLRGGRRHRAQGPVR
ncbi:MAG TPA: hypothetical protein VGD08_12975 [Stellaceae bacterium]|jgi:hypothetical protein